MVMAMSNGTGNDNGSLVVMMMMTTPGRQWHVVG